MSSQSNCQDSDCDIDQEEQYLNRCLICGVDMGDCNPRQLCGKWRCLDEDVYTESPNTPKKQIVTT